MCRRRLCEHHSRKLLPQVQRRKQAGEEEQEPGEWEEGGKGEEERGGGNGGTWAEKSAVRHRKHTARKECRDPIGRREFEPGQSGAVTAKRRHGQIYQLFLLLPSTEV